MKNLIKTMFLACALAVGVTSCGEDADMPGNHGAPISPQKEVAGTYNGTWSRDKNDGAEVLTAPGSLTLADAGEYVVAVTPVCNDWSLSLKVPTANANISRNGSMVYTFYNIYEGNPFGVQYNGTVKDGTATMTYTVKTKEGRKEVTYVYSFEGKKAN